MQMSPLQWAIRPLKKYATFSGRAPRAEFWWFMLLLTVAYVILTVTMVGSLASLGASSSDPNAMMGVAGMFGGAGILLLVVYLALLIPTLAVQVRRLHDTGRSGWWVGALYLLYIVYYAYLLTVGMKSATNPEFVDGSAGPVIGMMIFGLLMMIWGIVLLVFFILPGTKGPNKYGPDPYGEDYGTVFQ